jgi:LSD1 subclass zinc finger protein
MAQAEESAEAAGARAGAAGGAAEIHVPCESCGATLTFEPGTTVLKCAHCGHENAIPDLDQPIQEVDFHATLESLKERAPETTERLVTCESCGASFTLAPDAHAGECPYCGSSVVTDTGQTRQLKPASLVPFQLSQEAAAERLGLWLKGLWFAPSGLARYAREEGKFLGIYAPHWTFDAETDSRYSGERGVFVQVPRTMTTMVKGRMQTRTMMVTETRWTRVRGFVRRNFDDVLVLASRHLPKQLAGKLFTWQLGQLVPYQDAYLAGFRAEAYQVDLEQGFVEAKEIMANQIRSDVMRDIGGNVQRVHSVDTSYGAISFKHILLPIWMAAYRYRARSFSFVVNGQTGEVRGERPWSWIKIGLAVAAVVVVGAAVYFFTQG